VIGGIYTQEERSTTNKVPVLGDLPLRRIPVQAESPARRPPGVLIFITPRTIKEGLTLRQ
jgi:type IV pilus assembly protein PilQ